MKKERQIFSVAASLTKKKIQQNSAVIDKEVS
jgi:hypothetical protein